MRVVSHGPTKAVLLSLLAAFACSEPVAAPNQPASPLSVPIKSSRTILSSGYLNDAELTMVDHDDGQRYTLNMETRELRRVSDGAVIQLTDSQRDSAATAISSAILNDPSIPDLEELAPSGQCTGHPGDPCAESLPIGGDPVSRFGVPIEMQPLNTHSRSSRPAKRPRKSSRRDVSPDEGLSIRLHTVLARRRQGRGRPSVAMVSFVHSASFKPTAALWLLQANSHCTDVINAALPQTIDYVGKRASWAKRAFDIASSQVVDGVISHFLPEGSSAALEFSDLTASATYAGIKVGFLRAEWNSYNCDTKEVTAGPYYYQNHTYTQTAYGNNYVCEYQSWQISWDGGNTWEPIQVQVCKFEQQE